jgi:hypothetical protein
MSFFHLEDGERNRYTSYDLLTLPQSVLRSKKRNEYSSACPQCGGHDRFRYWPDVGNFWCRQCDLRGFVTDAPEERVAGPLLRDIVGAKVTTSTPEFEKWREYHLRLQDSVEGQIYWMDALGPDYVDAIFDFKLGWAEHHTLGSSAVIPVQFGGKIVMVKHRLIGKRQSKYMTEPSGFDAMLYGLDDALQYKKVVIVEGEKKAIRLWMEGYPAISPTNGANGFYSYPMWRVFFREKECITVFDPDAEGQEQANFTAGLLQGTNVVLPDKVDDWINDGGKISQYLGEPWR